MNDSKPQDATVLEIRDLVVRYEPEERGEAAAPVQDVDLDVPDGRMTVLVGPSGCGKTTLLRAIAGFERPLAGTIRLAGRTLFGAGEWVAPEQRRIGMVFQEGALFPHLDVRHNVSYGLGKLPAAEREARIGRALELVGLPDLGARYPDELSGGQQQRVALARALAPEPRLVLLDEPFASLDAALRQRLRADVKQILRQAGATVLLVTHDQEEALSLADRVAVMKNGRIHQVGPPDQIYRNPTSPEVAEFFGAGHLLPCEIRDGRASSELGSVACHQPDGTAFLFVRPEDVEMLSVAEIGGDVEPGTGGEIVERRFFGHDVLDRVRLTSGTELEVRVLSPAVLPLGSRVTLALRRGDLPVFSSPS